MTSKKPKTVFLKYTGNYKSVTYGVPGPNAPGDVIEVPREFGEALAKQESLFELAEEPKTKIEPPIPVVKGD